MSWLFPEVVSSLHYMGSISILGKMNRAQETEGDLTIGCPLTIGVCWVGFKISEIKTLYLLEDIKGGHCRTQQRKELHPVCESIQPLLDRPWECSPFSPLSLPRSQGQDDGGSCFHMECPLRASKKLFCECYYPNSTAKETDQPGKKKQRPLSSISWQVTLNSFLLISARVAAASSYSVSKLITRQQSVVHLEAPGQWDEANPSPHCLLPLEQTRLW